MEKQSVPWFRVVVLVVEVVLVGLAVAFPLVVTDSTLQLGLKILQLLAGQALDS